MRECCQCCPHRRWGSRLPRWPVYPRPVKLHARPFDMPLLVLDERWISLRAGRRGATRGDAMRCHAMPCETTNQPMHSVPPRPHLPNPGSCNHQRPSQTTYSLKRFEHHKQYPTRPEGHPQARSNVYILGSLATHHRRPPEPPPAKTHPISRNAPSMALHERQLKFKTWLPPYSTVPLITCLDSFVRFFFSICGR